MAGLKSGKGLERIERLLAHGLLLIKDGINQANRLKANVDEHVQQIEHLKVGDLDDQIETLELKMDAVRLLRDHKPQEGVNYDEELAFMDIELKQLKEKRSKLEHPQSSLDLD